MKENMQFVKIGTEMFEELKTSLFMGGTEELEDLIRLSYNLT